MTPEISFKVVVFGQTVKEYYTYLLEYMASNSARIKPYGPSLQNRWFKYDRVSNIFFTNFLLPEALNGQKSCEIRVIFSNS